jgi:pimeloyl-ACP methyl ester carboxylesterase
MAEDLELFIKHHDIQKGTLIGHSMGAKAVMAVALRQNVKIGNLISVDNAPVDAALKSDFAKYTVGMRRIEETGVKSLKEADKILMDYEENMGIRQFLLTNLVRGEDGTQKFKVPLKYLPLCGRFFPKFELASIDAGHWVISEKPEEFRQGE